MTGKLDSSAADERSDKTTHVFIVGAGFSRYAGLPLQAGFTEALLEPRYDQASFTKPLVEHLSKFISRAFDHSTSAKARYWPDLEDVFTSIDMAANTGHHLGIDDPPSALRTTRRVLLTQMMCMLNERYEQAARRSDANWAKLDNFFAALQLPRSAFISLNWDTVIERRLTQVCGVEFFNYGCGAVAAEFPKDDCVVQRRPVKHVQQVRVVKIHGSVNWLYCDNCRRLCWFPPGAARDVALQLLSDREAENLSFDSHGCGKWKCWSCQTVSLTTRQATFSYLKALDFPMFERSWQTAERLLRQAEKWVFIGYSLPAADFEFKHLLKRVQLARAANPPEFLVITGGQHTKDTYTNYQRFFGRAIKRKSNFFARGLSRRAIEAALG